MVLPDRLRSGRNDFGPSFASPSLSQEKYDSQSLQQLPSAPRLRSAATMLHWCWGELCRNRSRPNGFEPPKNRTAKNREWCTFLHNPCHRRRSCRKFPIWARRGRLTLRSWRLGEKHLAVHTKRLRTSKKSHGQKLQTLHIFAQSSRRGRSPPSLALTRHE